jgi:predicted Zn-dependent protease
MNGIASFDFDRLLREMPDAQWVGIRGVRETTTWRTIRDGRPESNSRHRTEGAMVEVLVRGQFGYAGTAATTPEALKEAALSAHRQALSAADWGVHAFTAEQRPPSVGTYRSPFLKPFDALTAAEICERLIRVCDKMKVSPKIVRRLATARFVETESIYRTSSGGDVRQHFHLVSTDFSATAQGDGVVQKRSDGGMMARSHQAGIEVLDAGDFWDRAVRVGEQAVELLSADDCPEEITSLVLMPDQMMLQIHESIGHPLELDRILGDERNYAGSSFVKPSDFGTLKYGSPVLNVTYDPTVAGEFASFGFDDNLAPARKEYLIKDGVLQRGLGGLESQARLGVPGVSTARACSWNRPPIDRMSNLNIEPGTATFAEIVESVEEGILMESNRSWSIDDYRRKFQFGCEYAQRIENGKIKRTFKNPNYRGVALPFWRGLKKVGSAETRGVFGTPHCGKGEPNQAIRVGHASPVCLFEGIEVFGGAS